VNTAARRIGRSLAFVLPLVLVLSGTLAVTRIPWAEPGGPAGSSAQVLTASSDEASSYRTGRRAPYEVLRDRLLVELQQEDPGAALTHLQVETNRRPSLARHCASIARALGRAAVAKYGGAAQRAQAYARPVCDTSYASGVARAQR
jgi:hypothetical protein